MLKGRQLRTPVAALAAILLLAPASAQAAMGDLDPSFGGDGTVVRDVVDGRIFGVVIDRQGRTVVAGTVDPDGADDGDVAVGRFLPNGAPDADFSGDGLATLEASGINERDFASAVAIDPFDRIVVAGQAGEPGPGFDSNTMIARLTDTGVPDPSFGAGDGIYVRDVGDDDALFAVRIDSAGRPVAAGALETGDDFLLTRVTAGGENDASFGGGDGFETINVNSVGSNDFAQSLALDSAGRPVVAGVTELPGENQNFAVARFTQDGLLDLSFSNEGVTLGRHIELMASQVSGSEEDAAADVVALPGGGVAMAGYAEIAGADTEIALLQLTPAGFPDPSFSADGRAYAGFATAEDEAEGLALDADGKLVTGGNSDPAPGSQVFSAARFLPDGTLDPSFSTDGLSSADVGPGSERAFDMAIDPVTRRVVVAGETVAGGTDWALARFEGVPRCAGKIPTLTGTPGKDKLKGTKGKDVISGGDGPDTISGLGKADTICGERGKDRLLGGKGNDRLLGGAGSDKLIGGKGAKDRLKGGKGKDVERQ